MAIESSIEYDPFLRKNVYGNLLDQVDNYQYNAKLYMIPPVAAATGTGSSATPQSGNAARSNSVPSNSSPSGQGGYMQNAMTAAPSQTVVLAQTGVTGVQIDNIEITSVVGPGGGINTSTINFDIIQPGAADFLDQILAARAYLGDQVFSNDVPLFLEIVFKGYSEDIDDADAGGEPILAAGPYRYRMALRSVSLEIDETGSTYAFSCVDLDHTAYADHLFRVPKKMESIGTTITEHVENLVKKINEHYKENYDAYQIQDEINIDVSGLTSGTYGLSDLSLTTDSDQRAEEINRIMNPELEDKDEAEYKDLLESATKDEGPIDIIVEENKVTVREGVSLDRYIATLLSMNDEFYTRITRTPVAGTGEGDTQPNRYQGIINWFKVNAGVTYIGYDKKRNAYAKKTVYKPVIYATARTDVEEQADENRNLTQDEINARLASMDIFKAYHYLFTGLNNQIKECRVEYKSGVAILSAPGGGFSGDFSTVMARTISNSAAITDDLSSEDLATKAVEANNQEAVSNLVDDARPDAIAQIANTLGFSAAQTRDAIQNRNGQSAQALKNTLSNRSAAQAISNAQRSTQSDSFSNPDGSDYQPTLSGYVYAGDIIGSVSERVETAVGLAEAQALAQRNLGEEASTEPSGPEPARQVRSVPNTAEDSTYNGTPRNTIFGYLMQQHRATDFLVNLDITIKGDPWYLGQPDSGVVNPDAAGSEDTNTNQTNPERIHLRGNDNYILFDLQTPKRYDFDVTDEDNNTGYWSQDGTAYFITGVYQIRKIINIFSSGEFSQELSMFKVTGLDLKRIGKEPQ